MVLFCDSSAFVKKYLAEAGREQVMKVLSEAEHIFISVLTELELTAALEQAKRLKRINSPDYRHAEADFERDLAKTHLSVVSIDLEIVRLSKRLIRQRRLRAPDAIQLASALLTNRKIDGLEFLCSDQALLEAARLEALPCIDPAK